MSCYYKIFPSSAASRWKQTETEGKSYTVTKEVWFVGRVIVECKIFFAPTTLIENDANKATSYYIA